MTWDDEMNAFSVLFCAPPPHAAHFYPSLSSPLCIPSHLFFACLFCVLVPVLCGELPAASCSLRRAFRGKQRGVSETAVRLNPPSPWESAPPFALTEDVKPPIARSVHPLLHGSYKPSRLRLRDRQWGSQDEERHPGEEPQEWGFWCCWRGIWFGDSQQCRGGARDAAFLDTYTPPV
jgi:hypothetical protein